MAGRYYWSWHHVSYSQTCRAALDHTCQISTVFGKVLLFHTWKEKYPANHGIIFHWKEKRPSTNICINTVLSDSSNSFQHQQTMVPRSRKPQSDPENSHPTSLKIQEKIYLKFYQVLKYIKEKNYYLKKSSAASYCKGCLISQSSFQSLGDWYSAQNLEHILSFSKQIWQLLLHE